MSATIYEKTPNGLYPTGDRTISTFPSGLVRVDQTFVCKTSAAATHRDALAVGSIFPNGSYINNAWTAYPSIEGFKIFPEVQEVQRTDGFTEFKVSGYGRTNTTGTVKKTTKGFWSANYESVSSFPVWRNFTSKDHTTSRVVLSSEAYDSTLDSSDIDLPVLISGPAVGTSPPYTLTQIGAQQITSFGYYEEITTTYGYVGYQVAS